MREDCRYYESRTYSSGEVVRMCRLDLAPDAPWRCPDDCAKYSRRTYDAGWTIAPLQPKPVPAEPEDTDDNAAQVLDQAEDIINAIGAEVLESVKRQREAQKKNPIARGAAKLRGRKRKKK